MKIASASSGGSVNTGVPGTNASERAAEGQQDRKRRADAPRDASQAHRGDKEREQLFEFAHSQYVG